MAKIGPVKEDQPTNVANKYGIQVPLFDLLLLIFNIFRSGDILIFNCKYDNLKSISNQLKWSQ